MYSCRQQGGFPATRRSLRMAQSTSEPAGVMERRAEDRHQGIEPGVVQMAAVVADVGALVRPEPFPPLHGRAHRPSRQHHGAGIHFASFAA